MKYVFDTILGVLIGCALFFAVHHVAARIKVWMDPPAIKCEGQLWT